MWRAFTAWRKLVRRHGPRRGGWYRLLYEGYRGSLETGRRRPASFVLSGGLSSLSYLVQIQADLFNKDIRISSAKEASALGAAFLAGMQQGTWTSEEITNLTTGGETVHGEPNPGLERRYRRWKELHRMTRELGRME
jgi:glycerol kinase